MNKLDIERENDEADVFSAVVSDDALESAGSKDAIAYYTYGCTGYHYCPGAPAVE